MRARLAAAGVSASTPGTMTWTVNREIIVVAGWGRAILLQFAHPLVATGVGDHSRFRGSLLSSFQRLHSTIGAMLSLTFGDEDEAIGAAAGINMIHDRVHGRLAATAGLYPAGSPYSAHDPELLRWVHATLLESLPMTYDLLVGPLTREQRDRYCAEATVMEPLLGIPGGLLPRDTTQLADYMRGMIHGGRIVVTETSRTLAHAVLFPPRWQLLWPAFRAIQLITIGLLPPGIREAYGFRWHARDVDAFVRWSTALRHVHRALPPVLREWPMARRAAGRL